MTDTNGPVFDKVGSLGPDVVEPPVGAPPPEGHPFIAVCPPAPAHMIERDAGKFADKPVDKLLDRPEPPAENKLNGGIGHSFGRPKPVEVMSVPQTPLNGSTPAGGTPRPELNIPEEPAPPERESLNEPVIEPIVMTGAKEPTPVPSISMPDEKPSAPAEESKPAIEEQKPAPAEPESVPAPPKEPTPEPDVLKAPELAVNESLVNGAMDIDEPENKPPAPVTHTGPESESVPAPAPAPAAAPVAAPPPAIPEAPMMTSESLPAIPPAEPAEAAEPSEAVVGEKRKLEENVAPFVDAVPATAKPLTEDRAAPVTLPLDKKPKLDENSFGSSAGESADAAASKSAPAPASVAAPTSAPAPTPTEAAETSPKAAKPKKEKKAPPVGRTARKTRSQGPADA